MSGQDADGPAPVGKGTLSAFLQRAVFPFFQGAPAVNVIAAKARALALALSPEFRSTMGRVRETSNAMADRLNELGFRVVSSGTDNHTVLVDLRELELTGLIAERALEDCEIVVNKNRVPGDRTPALVTSGIRLGSNSIAQRGMAADEARLCAELVAQVLRAVQAIGLRDYLLPNDIRREVRRAVMDLCARFPLQGYPAPAYDLFSA
jgi:glycine hydroxymethyltransferase